MNIRPNCYGTLIPDFSRLSYNKPLASKAFTALVISRGIGIRSSKLEVNSEAWANCVACPEYRHCYDLGIARLLMNAAMAGGFQGV